MTSYRFYRVPLMASVLALVLLSTVAHSQVPQVECRELLRQIYMRIREVTGSDKSSYAKYTVTTVALVRGNPVTSTSDVEMIANSSCLHMRSSAMEIYQDANAYVSIAPAARTIYISNSTPGKLRENRSKLMNAVQDSLLAYSQITECADITSNGSNKRIVITLLPSAQRTLGIKTVTYLMNSKQKTVQRMRIAYLPTSRVSSVDVTFNKMDFDYHTQVLSRPVVEEVFDARGVLIAKFNGYRVVDARRKQGSR